MIPVLHEGQLDVLARQVFDEAHGVLPGNVGIAHALQDVHGRAGLDRAAEDKVPAPILDQLPQSQVEYMRSKIPMGRLGEVHETAAMVCFMASEECSFTTASTFDTSVVLPYWALHSPKKRCR